MSITADLLTSPQTQNDPTTYSLATCEVCGETSTGATLNLGSQALCDDLIPVDSDRTCVRYPIEISICPTCLTANQVHRIRKETLFPQSYHYRPRFTKDVLDGMRGLVSETENLYGSVADKLVVDVGCNDGSLLNFFRDRGAKTGGIEPTGAASEAKHSGHSVIPSYFSPQSAAELVSRMGNPDIITFTNVFAHIEYLEEAIEALKLMIKPDSLVIIENHYLGSVLESFQFDTFYHEHPRTYSAKSFDFIAEKLGGEVISKSFPSRYGGNIRVVISNFGSNIYSKVNADEQLVRDEEAFPKQLEKMQSDVLAWTETSKRRLEDLPKNLCGKSFPGRAAILAHLLEIDGERMPVVFEKPGSLKVGHYLPGTRCRIESDSVWMEDKSQHPEAMFIWGWHIADEISTYLRKSGYTGKIFTPLPELREIHPA